MVTVSTNRLAVALHPGMSRGSPTLHYGGQHMEVRCKGFVWRGTPSTGLDAPSADDPGLCVEALEDGRVIPTFQEL